MQTASFKSIRWFFAGYRPFVHVPLFCFLLCFVLTCTFSSITRCNGELIPFFLEGVLRGAFALMISAVLIFLVWGSGVSCIGLAPVFSNYCETVFPKWGVHKTWMNEPLSFNEGNSTIFPWKVSLYLTLFMTGISYVILLPFVLSSPLLWIFYLRAIRKEAN